MPYRENANLDALIDSEPTVLEERRRVRASVDELQATADQLAQELAEHDDRGLLATVGSWLGAGPDAAQLERKRAEHARLTTQLAELVEAERALEARFAQIADARRARAAALATRAASLRMEHSPLGDQLRTLDASIAEIDGKLAALDGVLAVADRALSAVGDLVALADDVAQSGSTPMRTARAAAIVGAVITAEAPAANEHERTVARVATLLPEVRDRLLELVQAARGRAREQVNGVAAVAGAPLSDPPQASFLFRQVATASTTLDALVTVLGAERRGLLDERGRIEAQATALVAGAH